MDSKSKESEIIGSWTYIRAVPLKPSGFEEKFRIARLKLKS